LIVGSSDSGTRATPERPIGLRHLERVPEHCVWELTNACNLDCVHCESESGPRRQDELTTDEALALCDDLAGLGCRLVNLSGGEPFLRPDWQRICARLIEREIEPIVVSNLTCLESDELAALARLGIRWIATSVDGPPEIHDRIRRTRGGTWSPWQRTQAAIATLKQRGHKVAAITHISLWNLDHLDRLAEILASMHVDLWQLQIGQPSGRLRAIAEEYLIRPGQLEAIYAFITRVRREGRLVLHVGDDIGFFGPDEPWVRGIDGEPSFFAGCNAGYRVLAIASDGAIRGCPSLAIEVGNIRETPLAEIWADESRFWWNAWDPSQIQGLCRRCSFQRLCRCGCKGLALATTGSVYRNIYCINQIMNLGGDPDRREVGGRLLASPPLAQEPK
jgi:radical SAM protein with 4Fe4S-binding SPASM domain